MTKKKQIRKVYIVIKHPYSCYDVVSVHSSAIKAMEEKFRLHREFEDTKGVQGCPDGSLVIHDRVMH